MSFKDDNAAFENWLREQCALIGCEIVEADLEYKHDQMTVDAFVFLRATFFRWAKRIEALLPEYAEAPPVLSVGDTHIENFGTWRDNEGRLVWGVNDFDEAAVIPYPFDLVRLATSIRLARLAGVSNQDAAAGIAKGYAQGLAAPRPTLLDEQEMWMREYVGVSDRKREKFWKKLYDLPAASAPAPALLVSKRACQTECRSQRSPQCIKREWVASDARLRGFGHFARRAGGEGGKGARAIGLGFGPCWGVGAVAISGALDWAIPIARPLARCSEWLRLPATCRQFAQDKSA